MYCIEKHKVSLRYAMKIIVRKNTDLFIKENKRCSSLPSESDNSWALTNFDFFLALHQKSVDLQNLAVLALNMSLPPSQLFLCKRHLYAIGPG